MSSLVYFIITSILYLGYIVGPYRVGSEISPYPAGPYRIADYFLLPYRFPIGSYGALSGAKSPKQGPNVRAHPNKIAIATLLTGASEYDVVVE